MENKLAVILDEIGIDKTDDILDSSLSGEMVEKMMTHVIMEDADPENQILQTISSLKEKLMSVREESAVYSISEDPDLITAERIRTHPLPYWVERMTINFLKMKHCPVEKDLFGWNLTWPDGDQFKNVIFQSDGLNAETSVLTLENSRIRGLALNLPFIAIGQPIPCASIQGLPDSVRGLWGLFEIRLQAGLKVNSQYIRIPMLRRRYLSIFISEQGKIFLPTARHIWDSLQTIEPTINRVTEHEDSVLIFNTLNQEAEKAGQKIFEELRKEHIASISREENRGTIAFRARRRAIDRVGLPEVKQYRLNRCEEEELDWKFELDSARQIVPEIRPVLLMKIIEDLV
ncbi:MAG: hypothetical protein KJ658_06325 [Proteobacteria bacterium]|nr:hypothetical protein [Pseudomonadota bacterium]